MSRSNAALAAGALLLLLVPGCVTEEVRPEAQAVPRLFDFEPASIYLAGAYHGVNLFFELEPGDAPDASEWMRGEGGNADSRGRVWADRQLPPIVPEIAPGGREIYRVRDIHRVDYVNSMFVIGNHGYLRMPQGRLYVFKEREGNFSFKFRGQSIVVPSASAWTPSVYYHAVEEPEEDGSRALVEKEVVQVGFAKIETFPAEGKWLVNGKTYYPRDSGGTLELGGAVHLTGVQ